MLTKAVFIVELQQVQSSSSCHKFYKTKSWVDSKKNSKKFHGLKEICWRIKIKSQSSFSRLRSFFLKKNRYYENLTKVDTKTVNKNSTLEYCQNVIKRNQKKSKKIPENKWTLFFLISIAQIVALRKPRITFKLK